MNNFTIQNLSLEKKSTKKIASYITVFVLMLVLVSVYLAWHLTNSDIERGRLNWQNRMSVVLSGRQDAAENWIYQQKKVLSNLSEEPRFRIYFESALNAALNPAPSNAIPTAHIDYLSIYLKKIAIENGYVHNVSSDFKISANIQKSKMAGIALTDATGRIILSTPNMPDISEKLMDYAFKKSKNSTLIYGPYLLENHKNTPIIAFITPIYSVQDDEKKQILGYAIALKPLTNSFFSQLIQPGEVAQTAQNYLFRSKGNMIEYLSPLHNKSGAPLGVFYSLDQNIPNLAATFALQNPKSFAIKMNYRGEKILAMGVKIKATNWILLRTITEKEALGPYKTRRNNIMLYSLLGVVLVAFLLIALWRHGASVKLSEVLEEQNHLLVKYMEISGFLRIVTNNQPTSITVIDQNGKYQFANYQACVNTGVSESEIIGKSLPDILEHSLGTSTQAAAVARKMAHDCKEAAHTGEKFTSFQRFDKNGEIITLKTDFIPFTIKEQPENDSSFETEKGVLIVEENISELMKERESREIALKALVKTLAMIIDARDPFSSKHSERVAEVAKVIAQQMSLDEIDINTVEISGALMNLGKILVPAELLTRAGSLNKDEIKSIRDSLLKTPDMLQNVNFEGPVVQTIRQSHAHYDGTGTPNLKEDDILLTARIVAVANVFVGMVSARSHRAGMDIKETVKIIHQQSGSIFDPKPVIALMNYVENKKGYEKWQNFSTPEENISKN